MGTWIASEWPEICHLQAVQPNHICYNAALSALQVGAQWKLAFSMLQRMTKAQRCFLGSLLLGRGAWCHSSRDELGGLAGAHVPSSPQRPESPIKILIALIKILLICMFYMYICIYVHVYICTCVYMYVCKNMYMHVVFLTVIYFVRTVICMYIYIHTYITSSITECFASLLKQASLANIVTFNTALGALGAARCWAEALEDPPPHEGLGCWFWLIGF